MTCMIDDCTAAARGHGLCSKHYTRWRRWGDPTYTTRRAPGQGELTAHGYIVHSQDYNKQYEHILVAEKALGKRLPTGAVIHHIDGNGANNTKSNLVVCPNEQYHKLLHTRERWLAYLDTPSMEGIDCPNPRLRTGWLARVKVSQRKLHIGSFSSKHEAIAARCTVIRTLLQGGIFKGERL